VAYNHQDSLNQMMLAELYNTVASLYDPSSTQFKTYSDKALATIDAAINASPGRVPVYFQKAQVYITRGDKDKALETLNYAASLNPDYYDSFCYLGRTYLFYEDEQKGYENIDACLDKGGINMIAPAGLVKSYINHYAEKEDMARLVKLYERLAGLEPTVENWTKLANLYATMGDKENAKRAAEKSIEVDPSVRQYAQEFIDSL
jgi:tetratricopeptide (TPR) repeat protein